MVFNTEVHTAADTCIIKDEPEPSYVIKEPSTPITGIPAQDDGQPTQVRLDDVSDLPDVHSAEAANVSSLR